MMDIALGGGCGGGCGGGGCGVPPGPWNAVPVGPGAGPPLGVKRICIASTRRLLPAEPAGDPFLVHPSQPKF